MWSLIKGLEILTTTFKLLNDGPLVLLPFKTNNILIREKRIRLGVVVVPDSFVVLIICNAIYWQTTPSLFDVVECSCRSFVIVVGIIICNAISTTYYQYKALSFSMFLMLLSFDCNPLLELYLQYYISELISIQTTLLLDLIVCWYICWCCLMLLFVVNQSLRYDYYYAIL